MSMTKGTLSAVCACAHAFNGLFLPEAPAVWNLTVGNGLPLSYKLCSHTEHYTHTHKPQGTKDVWYQTCVRDWNGMRPYTACSYHCIPRDISGTLRIVEMEIEDIVRVEMRRRAAATTVEGCICWWLLIFILTPVESSEAGGICSIRQRMRPRRAVDNIR